MHSSGVDCMHAHHAEKQVEACLPNSIWTMRMYCDILDKKTAANYQDDENERVDISARQ